MSENPHSNIDARDLWTLAQRLRESETSDSQAVVGAAETAVGPLNEIIPMLLRAAEHLQRMDEKSLRGDFAGGLKFAEEKAQARSNILRSGRRVTNEDKELLIGALAVNVTKIPIGARSPKKPDQIDLTRVKSAPARAGFKIGDL